jgi:hypothetical protein
MLCDPIGPQGADIGFGDMAVLGEVRYRSADAGEWGGGGEKALVYLARGEHPADVLPEEG